MKGTIEEIHIIPDTNAILHFNFFEVPWRKELNARRVVIHISLIVLSEIGRLKDEGDSKAIRERARNRVRQLASFLDSPNTIVLREGESLVFEEERADCSVHKDLNERFGDHQLIATAILLKRKHGEEVAIATADLALRIQLRRFEIRTIALDEKHRQTISDPSEKRIQDLLAEIQRLEKQKPKLTASLKEGKTIQRFTAFTDESRDAKAKALAAKAVSEQRKKLPYKNWNDSGSQNPLYIPTIFSSKEEVEKYNARLDSYFSELETWSYKEFFRKQGSIKIELNVANEGASPAQRVSAWFHFPDGFEVIEASDYRSTISRPPEPPVDSSKFLGLAGALDLARVGPVYLNPQAQSVPVLSSLSVKKTNSYEVEFIHDRIRQGESVNVDCLIATFGGSSKSFQIDYRLICDNCSEVQTGHISVVFEAKHG